MRLHRSLLAGLSIAALAPASLLAQGGTLASIERSGFYGSLGLAYGYSTIQWSGSAGSTSTGAAAYVLTVGYVLSPSWRLGAEAEFLLSPNHFVTTQSSDFTSSYYSATATYFDADGGHLWAKGNLGYATYSSDYNNENPGGGGGIVPYNEGGLAAGVGLGYDFQLGHGAISVSPFVSYEQQLTAGTITLAPGATISGRTSYFAGGLSVGFNR